MDNKEFIDYLTKYFGNKVLNVLEETEKGVFINSSKIEAYNSANPITIDKCTDCIATKHRQDLPFWIIIVIKKLWLLLKMQEKEMKIKK